MQVLLHVVWYGFQTYSIAVLYHINHHQIVIVVIITIIYTSVIVSYKGGKTHQTQQSI